MTSAQLAKPSRKQRVRTLWISDVHLGTRDCQAEHLAAFLKRYHADRIYLVGDIIDGWRLKRSWHWPQAHNDVVQKIMRKARKGTNVVYIPGNHDEAARQYCQLTFGDVRVEDEVIHETPDGRKLLVIHGDQFDGIVRYARWLAILGDWAYAAALRLNTIFNWGRRKLGLPYWSLSAFLKHRVKNAVQFIDDFEHAVATEARRRGGHALGLLVANADDLRLRMLMHHAQQVAHVHVIEADPDDAEHLSPSALVAQPHVDRRDGEDDRPEQDAPRPLRHLQQRQQRAERHAADNDPADLLAAFGARTGGDVLRPALPQRAHPVGVHPEGEVVGGADVHRHVAHLLGQGRLHVFGLVALGKQSGVDCWVKRFDATVENLGEVCQFGDILHREPGIDECCARTAGGNQLDCELGI